MTDESKGRTPDNAILMTKEEAADMLGVPLSVFAQLLRKKLVKPVSRRWRNVLFHPKDIMALSPLLDKRMDLGDVGYMALQALAVATRTERRMQEWFTAQGAPFVPLNPNYKDIALLAARMKREMKADLASYRADEVVEWARIILSVDVDYLKMVAHQTRNVDPWRWFLELADRFSVAAPRHLFGAHRDLQAAYSYLEVARKNLRQVAYLYCRMERGPTLAAALFPEPTNDITRIVMSLMTFD